MKRIVSLLLSLLLVISMIPTAAFAAEEVTEPEVISTEEVTEPEAITAEEATAPETVPTGEVTEPETAPSEEVTEAETVPVEEVTEPETLPAEEVTEPETEPAGEATEPEAEEETQTPEPRSGDTMSQEDFLTALEAAGNSYTLTQRVTVSSGVSLSCEVVIAEGGKLVVEEGASLVTSALLKVDGGQLQLGYGSTLATEGSGVVCVVSGSLYDGGTNLSLEGITPYIEQYPRGSISNMDSSHICYITDISSARDLNSALNSYGNYGSLRLYARSSISYRGQLTLPGNVVLYLRATDTATGSLVLEADSTLTLEGMIVLEGSGAKLNVEKTASLVNCGEIFVQADAVLRIREGAALDNQGLVKVNEGGTFYGNGTLTGKNIDGTVSKEDTSVLEELKEGLSQGSYTLNKRLVLTESMTFHETVTIAEGGSLVIPRGVTLYFNDDGGLIVDGGHFKVESGGKVSGGNYDTCRITVNSGSFTILSGGEVSLNNTWAGYLRINGGDVTVYGGTVLKVSEISMTLPTTAKVNGIDPKQILTSGTFSTMEELRQLLSLGSAYRQLGVSLSSGVEDFTLESVTIPRDATLSFGNVSGEIRIPEGAVVENQGKLSLTYSALRLQPGSKLLNKGLMDLYGGIVRIHSGSELVNTGTLRAEVSSMLHIQEGGLLDNPGSLFHTKDVLINGQVAGNPPRLQDRDDVYNEFGREVTTPHGFGVALMEAKNSDADFYIYVRCQLEAEEDLTVPYNVHLVFLGENSGLTVKPGATVTLNCIAASFTGSDLTVRSGAALVVNHSASIGGGGFLLAEEGSTLALNTNLYVDKGCAQVYGTVTGQGKVEERTGESQTDPVIVTSSSQLVSELANAAAWDDTYTIYIQSDLVLEQSVTVPENAALVVRYPGSRLCLAEGVSLTNDGSISVSSLASLSISRNAILIGNSLIRMNGCATMTVQEGGTLVVNMRIDQEKGCSITVYGTLDKLNGMVEGTVYYPNEREPLTQAQFQMLVSESNGSFTLDRPLTLNGFQFPENFRLTLAKGADLKMAGSFDGEMVVQNGAKLTLDGGSVNDGTITLHSGAELVASGGFNDVTNNGTIILGSGARMVMVYGKTIINQGEIRIHSGSQVEIGGEYAGITGKDPVYLAPEKDTGILEWDPLHEEDFLNDQYYNVDISSGRFTAYNFNLLYRAIQMAEEAADMKLYVSVRSSMTITEDLHLPGNVYLYIEDGVRLSVAQGVTLSCAESAGIRATNAELRVKSGGKLVAYNVNLEENGILYVEKEGTLQAPGSIRTQSNGQLINWGTLESSSIITLDSGSKGLTNYGMLTTSNSVYLRGGALLDNRGTLTNQDVIRLEEGGQLKNAGELTNNGSLIGEKGSVFKNSGTLYNEGRLIFREGATATNTGKLTGAGDIEDQSGTLQNKDYAEFLKGVRSGWAEVRKTITVTEDLYIEDAVIFIQEGGNLVIPDGVTVTYDLRSEDTDNRIRIYRGGKLTVEEGGTLVNNYNIVAMNGSQVENNGTYTHGENGVLWIQEETRVSGIPNSQLGLSCYVSNLGEFQAVLDAQGYLVKELQINGSLTVSSPVTVGKDVRLTMETYGQHINITEGGVLTLEGDVDLRAGGFKVRSGGTLVINGTVTNEANGEIALYEGGEILCSGTILGKEPITVTEDTIQASPSISQAEFKAKTKEHEYGCSLENSVTITSDMTVSGVRWLEITGNGLLRPMITISSGAELILKDSVLALNGSRLVVEPGAKLTLSNAHLMVQQDALVQIADGGCLKDDDGGEVTVYDHGVLRLANAETGLDQEEGDSILITGYAQVSGVPYSHIRVYDTAVSSTRELKHYLDTFSDCCRMQLYVSSPFTLTEDVTLPENVYLQLDTWYECIPQMTVAPGVTLTAEGEIEVQGVGAELNIEGTLIKRKDRTSVWESGALNIRSGGTMINEATLQISHSGTVTLCEGGTLENRDYITTENGGQLILNGTFTGNPVGQMPQLVTLEVGSWEELEAILAEAAESIDRFDLWLIEDITLGRTVTVPGNVLLQVALDSTLTVPEGSVLTADGELVLVTGQLYVEAGGRFINNRNLQVLQGSTLWVKAGADLENNGQILCDAVSWLLMDGTFINLGTVEGQFIPSDQRAVSVYSWKELQEALESGAPSIDVMADLTVSKDLTIQNTLRIPQGVTVTVRSGATLDVQGTVAVYGTLKINGQTQGNRIEAYGGTVTGPQGSWRTEGQLAQEIRFACNTAMGLGMQQYLNAWVYPADAWDIGVSYEILEGGEFATLEEGLLIATGVGEVTIRATSADGNATADITLRILDYSVVIDETRSVSRLTEGSKGQIYADLVPGNLTDTEILFSLAEGDEEYAKLSAKNGVATLTAKSLEDGRTVTVLAESKDGQALAAEWKVTLVPKAQSVVILDEAGEPIASGATVTYDLRNQDNLAADCLIFDATTLPDASLGEVSWSCSDTKGKLVSTVDLSVPNRIRLEGFTGKTGTLTLTAAAADGSGKKANVKLKLVALPQNIVLAESTRDWLLAGKSMTLKAVDGDTGMAIAASALGWSLVREQDEAYVTLTPNGKLTARKLAQQQTVEVAGYVLGNEEIAWVSFPVTIYPATTQVSILYETEGWTEDITGTTLFLAAAEESIDLDPWLYPTGELGAMQTVTWKSSNKSVATVDEDGIVTGTGKTGNVTITATAADGSGKKATVKLKYGIMTRDIDLLLGKEPFDNTENTLALRSGQSISITGRTVPEKPTTRGVTFFLEDPADGDCLQVSASGKLTAKTVFIPRSVNVVARSKDGGASEVIVVRVLPKEERQLLLLDGQETNLTRSAKVVQKLDTVTLTAKLLDTSDPENISLEDAQVTWRSSNERIAQLSGTTGSTVTAELLRSGSATITATTADGIKTTVTVKAVDRLADSIRITDKAGNETLVVASGKSLSLAAQVLDREGGPASNKNVTWQVLWGEVKISSSGKLTATSGLAQCSVALVEATARDGSGVTQQVNVVIVPLTQSISLFREDTEVTNLTLTLAPGDTLELSAETFPTLEIPEGEALRTVTWRSSAKKVAEIDSVTGELTALTPGTTNITATATDGSGKKATVKIRVE